MYGLRMPLSLSVPVETQICAQYSMHGPNNAQSLTKLSNKLSNITNGRVSGVYQLGVVEMILPQIKNWGGVIFCLSCITEPRHKLKGLLLGTGR